MKRQKVDSHRERRLLIAMIVSRQFLSQAARVLDLDLIDVPHYRQVAEWCLDYWKEYGKAPGKHIETLYHAWSEDNENTDLVNGVSDFLESLSEDFDKDTDLNVPYLMDELGEFLAKRKIVRLQQDLEYSLSQGNVKEAEESLTSYRSIEVGQGTGFDPMTDKSGWREAFSNPAKPIVTFDGDAGRFFNPAFTRDALVGIQAPEKTGKTWWCVEFVMRALRQRRKVALFEVGDLSKSQIMLRLGMRWAMAPLWRKQCGKIVVPQSIEIDDEEDSGYKVHARVVKSPIPVSRSAVKEGIRRFRRSSGLSESISYIRSSVHPTGSINVVGISSMLEQWKIDHDFIPDVIVIDYADILAPEDPKKRDPRDLVNDTWMALRRLSQERHALVITPTQAKATTYGHEEPVLQTMKDFSNDKRKYAHVTGMFGLNQTPEEKDKGGMRLNWLVLREAPFNTSRPLYVGTCFALGKALCCAKF